MMISSQHLIAIARRFDKLLETHFTSKMTQACTTKQRRAIQKFIIEQEYGNFENFINTYGPLTQNELVIFYLLLACMKETGDI